ncbi:putative guanine nucleotide exchange factor protein [Rosellinia necatrix]|uniref:Putative guanine nucleotide exchange factor protein n=1 Tax=Rosellinia necatrix TaxID=77044 RepID=A0A1W2TTQ5_ROSNE|nr:putative guanine nucleotide exchange factor protein [Rosellinia necatrix]
MPPPEQPLHEPPTSRIAASHHDPAMSHPKTTNEDLPDNAPPIAVTCAPSPSQPDTAARADEQKGDRGSQSTSSPAPGDAPRPDMTRPTEHGPPENTPEGQDAAENDQPDGHEPDGTVEAMESSVATLKPKKPQYLTINTAPYVDPTPPTPTASQTPSRANSAHRSKGQSSGSSPTPSDTGYDEARFASEDEREGSSRSEIQSIMEQFPEDGGGPGAEEVMSPRLEIASPHLASPPLQHPPRKSSLEPLAPSIAQQLQEIQASISSTSPTSARSKGKLHAHDHGPPVPPKDSRSEDRLTESPVSSTTTLHRPPPPEPEPEPALPFDFHRFLEQLKHKKADPVARYLKSFLNEFGKRQWMVHEQVKIIGDFLTFIANKMAQCEVWREVSDAEFDNAREGMEKLVMNRLYTQTFSPAIPAPQAIPGAKPKKRGGDPPMGPGRKGQHQEDVERDDILAQKVSIYGWVREEHLDIPAVTDSGKRFLALAQQELLKIRSYRAPRDKIICVLNCCKVIFGLLKHNKSDSSADSFMPLLIYVVLRANPDHLVSNVQYILRFRNQDKLGGEAGYYLSSLMGAVQFIENMDRTTLTISDEDFEQNVEAAVSAIAEKHRTEESATRLSTSLSEKGGLYPRESSSTRPSFEQDGSRTPRRSTSHDGHESGDETPAISGLLRTIQKPLSSIGRIFSEEPSAAGPSTPPPVPQQNPTPSRPSTRPIIKPNPDTQVPPAAVRQQLSAQEAAARQASAEAAEAYRLQRAEHNNVVETLAGMFPDLDRDIISDVVHQKEGRVGLAVDACLALSA